ncbi:conserved hypothetical protein [Ricinus communis]|uniref:DDE Tnp4 domain-containing protein n=1 Tax=Ricinus communis TaxID=3988 RepID=B9SJT1_RICCO|nr:conserved hypothetical protein [Ricinus communis]
MTAPIKGRARYRNKKDDLSTNILRVFDPKINSSYVLPSWEGSVSDSQILGDALHRRHEKYYLVDAKYINGLGCLAPYQETRYHLNLWRGNTPTNYKELFNLQDSSAINTIERAFGLLKKWWAIFWTLSFLDKKTQVRIINACFIVHNFENYATLSHFAPIEGNKSEGEWKPQAYQAITDALNARLSLKLVINIFEAPGYDNKIIENWDDIVILCGSDRATRDGAKNFEDTAEAMNQEGNEVQSNIKLEE